ncbi:orotate phosphoribosyltransferase [Patescibacteria group bacterium]
MLASQVAEILLKVNAVKLNVKEPFTYTSGLKGPIYTDNRLLISYPEYRDVIVDGFIDMMEERGLKPEYLVGPATGGIPWAAIMADRLKLPMIYVRSKPKGHGAGKQIEGYLPEGKSALITEDLITTGGSALRSVEATRKEGKAIVHDVFAIFTYGTQKAEDAFREASCALSTLTDVNVLLDVAVERGDVSEEEAQEVRNYFKAPTEWGPNKK